MNHRGARPDPSPVVQYKGDFILLTTFFRYFFFINRPWTGNNWFFGKGGRGNQSTAMQQVGVGEIG